MSSTGGCNFVWMGRTSHRSGRPGPNFSRNGGPPVLAYATPSRPWGWPWWRLIANYNMHRGCSARALGIVAVGSLRLATSHQCGRSVRTCFACTDIIPHKSHVSSHKGHVYFHIWRSMPEASVSPRCEREVTEDTSEEDALCANASLGIEKMLVP